MGRYAKEPTGSGEFQQCPPGTHVARCIGLIDLGTQRSEYKGDTVIREQVVVQWEVPGETVETDDGPKPMIVSKFYTNSLSEKANLRADLEMWRGRQFTPAELGGFDLEAILGKACLVTVVHNDSGKAKVMGITSLPKGAACPPAVNEPHAFWIDPWDDAAFMALPKGFRKIIEQSKEFQAFAGGGQPAQTPKQSADLVEDDIPFN